MWFKPKPLDIKEMVAGVSNLVSLPQAYFRISQMLNNPHTTAAQLGEVISHDPALTARLLRFVNSPVYAMRNPVDSVARAVSILGMQELRMLALASSVGNAFQKPPSDLVDMAAYWHHSVFTGIVAKQLGKLCKLPSVDRLFVAGLLHDVGQLVLAHQAPDAMRKVVALLPKYPHHRCQMEQKLLGHDHSEVGAELMRYWQLPESLWMPVRYHHAPELAPEYMLEACLVHMANAIADGVEPSRRGAAPLAYSPISPKAWEMSGLEAAAIAPVVQEANLELFDMLDIIAPSGGMVF
ncbi:HDOD domain-containing protein [Methylogaea oryzae]|uniref:HD family phosphohydrolase n=1 Tax=Methylogaea oryzae TaxID=1295382 RepID=A0A8D4VKX1_9GAMM|nr:HDOD domain-containing protein [Methylogaea oryzae]BBL69412.1 HD family phosphohydrolase [Methylogaea oryzae]